MAPGAELTFAGRRSLFFMDMLQLFSAVFTLTLVMDPLGNMPLFITALKGVPENRRRAVVTRELFIALAIMVFFLLFGRYIMSLLALDMVSLSVGGGIVLFIISLQMIFPSSHSTFADGPEGEPFIVPLAIPLIAGPSTLTTILIFSLSDSPSGGLLGTLLVVVISWLINMAVLAGFSNRISGFLGTRGLLAMEKLMGMILVTISVQMIMVGIKKFIVG